MQCRNVYIFNIFCPGLEDELIQVQLLKEAPHSLQCSVCKCVTSSPIRCHDCDHSIQYCSECEPKCHSNTYFHKPEIWQVIDNIAQYRYAMHTHVRIISYLFILFKSLKHYFLVLLTIKIKINKERCWVHSGVYFERARQPIRMHD